MPPKPGKRGGGGAKRVGGGAKAGGAKKAGGAGGAKGGARAGGARGSKPKKATHAGGPILLNTSRNRLATGSSLDLIRPVKDGPLNMKLRGEQARNTGQLASPSRSPRESSEGCDGLLRVKKPSSAATTAFKDSMRSSITNLFLTSKGKNPLLIFKSDTTKMNLNKNQAILHKSDKTKHITFNSIPMNSSRQQSRPQSLPANCYDDQSVLSTIVSEDSVTSGKLR